MVWCGTMIENERASQNLQEHLRHAITDYKGEQKSGSLTPEVVTRYWQVKFTVDGERAGIDFAVPDCDWTAEAIRRPMVDIRGREIPGLMIPVIRGVTLPVLGRMYPLMHNSSVREGIYSMPIKDVHNTEGWVKVYASMESPNCNTSRRDAERFAKDKGYLEGREITYILGSQAYKELNLDNDTEGHYFDENGETWSFLPGSRVGDRLIDANFYPDGDLYVFCGLDPDVPFRFEGWRFEEVEKA